MSLFPEDTGKAGKTPTIRKVPYKFFYVFEDDAGKKSRLMIEDWEIGQLYWNCLARADGDEAAAVEKVRLKYEGAFLKEHDIHLFLGTTKLYHNRSKNPFVIIGVFYPKRREQLTLKFE
jgi:hypothetical protein